MAYEFWHTAGEWPEMDKMDSAVVMSVRETHYSLKTQYMRTTCWRW